MPNPVSFRYFKTSPEIIQLAVMLYVRFPLSLRNVEDLLHERGWTRHTEEMREQAKDMLWLWWGQDNILFCWLLTSGNKDLWL